MKIEYKPLLDRIHLLIFENQFDITSTFLRFQEHYESPKFSGTVFSLDEYKDWYTKTSPNGIKTGEFTYYSDWSGFNIPSTVLKPFYEGKFDPLSEPERELLSILENKPEPFYVIGIHKQAKNVENLLKHETAHGLFFTNPEYKTKVIEIISKYDTSEIRKELLESGGYNEQVLDDEVHAYSLVGSRSMKAHFPDGLKAEIESIFNETSKNIDFKKVTA